MVRSAAAGGALAMLCAAGAACAQPEDALVGVTAEQGVEAGLYRVEATGVSTAPMREAAAALLDSLSAEQRARINLPLDSPVWRDWNYIAAYPHGDIALADLSQAQRERAYDLMRASLSVRGFEQSRDIMRLNQVLGDMIGHRGVYRTELGYWLTVFGTPHETRPWGWQIEGHHLVLNFLVLGEQIVATPAFMGTNPVAPTPEEQSIFREEEDAAFALVTSLDEAQLRAAVISAQKPGEIFTGIGRDNFELRYEGLAHGDMNAAQQAMLIGLIEAYVRNFRPGHDRIRMDEIRAHLDRTYFAWAGALAPGGVFYYRVHSPVVLIEFDHQRPDSGRPRDHVHTIVRTPNGGDYGADLLRRHYEAHDRGGEHAH